MYLIIGRAYIMNFKGLTLDGQFGCTPKKDLFQIKCLLRPQYRNSSNHMQCGLLLVLLLPFKSVPHNLSFLINKYCHLKLKRIVHMSTDISL